MLMYSIILAISGSDTLRPPNISFRPFANSACETEYHNGEVHYQYNIEFIRCTK